jgi:hypothetical protein
VPYRKKVPVSYRFSAQVWHTDEVNGWAVGTYSLTDSSGGSATPITRAVDVANCPW